MLKKIWRAIWGFGKKEIIAVVKSQQDDLECLIKTFMDEVDPETLPKRLSKGIIAFIVMKIEKI